MSEPAPAGVPRAGMLATVRNRTGVVAAVEPFDGPGGRQHLVHVEYKDSGSPASERLLWELEPHRTLLEPTALPDAARGEAMPAADYDALLRAARWTALSPYLDPGGAGPPRLQALASPFHGAVRPEDYQLVPLLKALRTPRVSLLIADDVGLGKTVEAGLILTELLLRRRIRRVLVLAPAALRWQWRDELWDNSRSASRWSTATSPSSPAAASAWTPIRGAPSTASSPPTTCNPARHRTVASVYSTRAAAAHIISPFREGYSIMIRKLPFIAAALFVRESDLRRCLRFRFREAFPARTE